MKLTVNLFPDSGHHLYFVPLSMGPGQAELPAAKQFLSKNNLPQLPSNSNVLTRITTLCTTASDWMPARSDQTRLLTWLRAKFGVKNEGSTEAPLQVLGLWLAIETNTGLWGDGFKHSTEPRPAANDPGWKKFRENPDSTSPYIQTKSSAVYDRNPLTVDLDAVFGLAQKVGGSLGPLELEINWLPPHETPLPVQLVVDFGNTRTIAFGLERARRKATMGLREICRPILFQLGHDDAATTNARRPSASELVPDSWVILREPQFAGPDFVPDRFVLKDYFTAPRAEPSFQRFSNMLLRRTVPQKLERIVRRMPFMFIDLSPAVIGPEATKILSNVKDIAGGHLSFLSSPKRYVWDNEQVGAGDGFTLWYMHPRIGDGATALLRGLLFLFLPRHPEYRRWIVDNENPTPPTEWDLSKSPTSHPVPDFGRADAMIWTALGIIERANRQILSESWRSRSPIPRYLEKVVVTFPPGWTNEEYSAYRTAWHLAAQIHNWTRGPHRREGATSFVDVDLSLDEALASQLAIIYSEIHHLGDRARDWMQLYGRVRGKERTVRVLTIDIGGGTLDTAVVEYHSNNNAQHSVDLRPVILFNDSSTNAGDKLVKDLIEAVLLPSLGDRFKSKPDDKSNFESVASASPWMREEEDRLRRMVITRAVFVPMVFKWLEDVASGRSRGSDGVPHRNPIECGANLDQIEKLNEMFREAGLEEEELLSFNAPFDVDNHRINQIIEAWCKPIAHLHERYVAAFQCDLVIVTGKPSELPQVRKMFEEQLPIDSNRIISAKDYYAGDWFPATSNGKIPDAKMVTVIGAALYQAIKNDLIPNWRIEEIISPHAPARNYWGVVRNLATPFDTDDILLKAEDDKATPTLPTFCVIGRARFPQNSPEPVYVLRWRDPTRGVARGRALIQVLLRRVRTTKNGDPLRTEHLKLEGVRGKDDAGNPISLEDMELQLHPLPLDEAHWLDRGRYRVRWD